MLDRKHRRLILPPASTAKLKNVHVSQGVKNMNQQLTVGHKLSMFLDLVVMLLWFLMIKFENKGLLTGLVIITILHICNLLFAIYILRSNQVRYSLDQQRKKLLIVSSLSVLVLISISFVTKGNTWPLFLMLFNGLLLLSYPNRRRSE